MTDKTSKLLQAALSLSEEERAALEWYLERSEPAASKVFDELSRAIRKISEAPQRWPVGKAGTRKVLLPAFHL
ncbi:MAG: hypothetical protein DMG40_09640 [Acidobacteria bacterium]|nr:MAG: hypothetical protein DMG40_09640 [Acidobacteriota bacterium]